MSQQVKQPDVTVNIVAASTTTANTSQKVLFVGQKVAAGTATSGALNENILNDNSWNTLFGQNSQIAGAIRDFRAINKVTEIDAISLDDASGTPATGTIAFSGTATAAGTYNVVIGSATNHSFDVAVASGDTATVVGASVIAAINADLDCPLTASNSTGTVTLTADNDGTIGNSYTLENTGTVAGLTVVVTGMASGATDPTLTSILDVVGSKRYQTILWPYADLSVVKSFLDARFNVNNAIQDGVAITCQIDTHSNLLTTLGALNSQSVVYLCDETTSNTTQKGGALVEIPYSQAAQSAAVRTLRLSDGESISDLVISANGVLDSFGGAALASKPYFNTNMANLPIIKTGLGFTETEVGQLQAAGGSVVGNNSANNGVVLGEMVTTYKTDSAGNPDVSFTFLNYVDTASNIREYFSNNIKKRFAQSRLTTGDVIRGRDMANAQTIAAYMTRLYSDLSGVDFVLVEAGEAALKFFKDNLTIAIDLTVGKVTITMKTPIVVQGRTFIVTQQIAFGTGA